MTKSYTRPSLLGELIVDNFAGGGGASTGIELATGRPIARCGNAVPPPFAEALVRANLPEMCGRKFESMKELREAM